MIQRLVDRTFQNPLERHETFQSFVKVAKHFYNVLEYLKTF